jgi:hypothetical protein
MSRPTFRRAPKLECLESRLVMSAGGPTADAQFMLELINEARTNPKAAADRYTSNIDAETKTTLDFYHVNLDDARQTIASATPKPPVAWSDQLAAAATGQSQDQANRGVQSHVSGDGATLTTRLDRVGYTGRNSSGENAFAYAKNVEQAMEAFLVDWGVPDKGHFNNLLQPGTSGDAAFRQVGIGIVDSSKAGLGPEVITQDFAAKNGAKPLLLGVAYNDSDHNHFYTPGEGRGDVTVEADNTDNSASASVQTWDSGGYQMELDPGHYQVTAKVGDQVVGRQQVDVGSTNVKVDFDLSQPQIAPAVAIQPAPAPAPAPPAPTPPSPPVVTTPPTPPQTQAAAPTPSAPPQTQAVATTPPAQAQGVVTYSPAVLARVAQLTGFSVDWITSWQSWDVPRGQSS